MAFQISVKEAQRKGKHIGDINKARERENIYIYIFVYIYVKKWQMTLLPPPTTLHGGSHVSEYELRAVRYMYCGCHPEREREQSAIEKKCERDVARARKKKKR